MLYYDRIDVSVGYDIHKTSISKEWYFPLFVFLKGFKFQLDVCNGCHDVLMMSMSLSNIAILSINGVDCHCIIKGFSKK